MANELVNYDELNNLSEQERKLVLQILSEYSQSGVSKTMDDLKYSDYNEIPVDILTFLYDDNYLGRAWKTSTGDKKLYEFWEGQLQKLFPDNITTAYNTLLESGARGIGKAQPLDAKVMTPNGYVTMGELSVGDKVIGSDGNTYNVIAVFPQGNKDVYRITFSDGTSTECCKEHLWNVIPRNCKKYEKTIALEELFDKPLTKKTKSGYNERLYYIPMTEPINFPTKELYIPPYVMGVMLGDGHISKRCCSLTSSDLEIVNKVQECFDEQLPEFKVSKLDDKYGYTLIQKDKKFKIGPKGNPVALPNKLVEKFNEYGLNITAKYKFIPKDYLVNSIENRIELLYGLMDTDGYINKCGSSIEFTTVSEQLKDDFIFLVESLGGSCRCKEFIAAYKKDNIRIECSKTYTIRFNLPRNIIPFHLSRKIERINKKSNNPSRSIEKIEFSRNTECKCILIDSNEHLYLTNNCIVTHNSEVACGCVGAYLMYRILCLKNPLEFYHLKPTEKICFAFMNIKKELAEEIANDKFQKTIQLSPWFMSKGQMTQRNNQPYWVPPEPLSIIIGSQSDDIIGLPIFFAFMDEISFIRNQDIDKQKAKAQDMIDTAVGGMFTRFIHNGKNPTMLVVASSKRSEQSFMESYIKKLSEQEGHNTLVIDKPVWEVKPKGTYSDKTFYVGLGNKYLASIVIPEEHYDLIGEYKEKGYKIISVPIDFKAKFLEDIERNLCDFAGISSSSSNKYMSAKIVSDTINSEFHNPFPDILEIGNNPEDKTQYYNFFKMEYIPEDLKYKPMYIHLDMSKTGDMTGIAGVWITGKKISTDDNTSKDLQFRLAFSVSIKAPKGWQISFEKNRNLIRWLKGQGFNIKEITADTYQSADLLQILSAEGYACNILSVDRVDTDGICKPYQYLRSTIYEKRFCMYKSERLFDEFVDIERNNNTGKLDHSPNGHKDALDAVCGAMYTASKHAEEYAYDFGEDMSIAVDYNKSLSDSNIKEQLVVDFEEELKKSHPLFEQQSQQTQFRDFGFGPASPYVNQYSSQGIVVF